LLEPVNPLNFLFVDSLKRCHRGPLWYGFDEDAFTPLALLNIPKLNLNQRKINEKKNFTRLGQSDLSAVLRPAAIRGTPQVIK
jgi:hypothetical protein